MGGSGGGCGRVGDGWGQVGALWLYIDSFTKSLLSAPATTLQQKTLRSSGRMLSYFSQLICQTSMLQLNCISLLLCSCPGAKKLYEQGLC